MAKDKLTLADASVFAKQISEMLDLAANAEKVHELRVAARAELEDLLGRIKEAKAEYATLQPKIESLKEEYAEFAAVDARTKRVRDLDKQIAERTGQLQSANRDLAVLRQQFADVG